MRTKKPKKTTTGAPVPLEDMTQSASESNTTSQFLDPYAQVPAQWEPPFSMQEAVARSDIVTLRQALDHKALNFNGIEEQYDDNHSLYALAIAQEQQPMQISQHIPLMPNIDPMLHVHSALQCQIPAAYSMSSESNLVAHVDVDDNPFNNVEDAATMNLTSTFIETMTYEDSATNEPYDMTQTPWVIKATEDEAASSVIETIGF
ncbi:uncharacterized protein EV420DRAFT_1485508 [Desarmillaria tabescens]|uniref:Uncharacterized protein n=1 Tax=Armillaria tabescens TaxID=1929756 RepID=A0AA39MPS3_ARMTA|nr:uncharacterized protein EV420DRAFT_1485508 [Desarmillaria tabescens]KAK0441768.1 hypothetical protein EV420DRAFT_1485508 [Desarmillaria tabescens]